MFIQPFMLFGLLAVSVPIVIHFLHRRRIIRMRWAAMRFLLDAAQRSQKRTRIEDLILLILRCGILAALVLALARPALSGTFFGTSPVNATILIDNSMSMNVSNGAESRLDRARKAAEQIIRSLPQGSSVSLWSAGDIARSVIERFSADLPAVLRSLREIEPSDHRGIALTSLASPLEALSSTKSASRELYVITDSQQANPIALQKAIEQIRGVQRQVHVTVVDVDSSIVRNLAITELRQASGIPAANESLRFSTDVTNFSDVEARDVRINLFINHQAGVSPVDQASIDTIPPGATRSVILLARVPAAGFQAITARIDSDALSSDNERTIVVETVSKVRVLLVDGSPGSRPSESEVYFLRHALAPVSQPESERHPVQVETISSLELSRTNLDEFNAVFIANVVGFSQPVAELLANYVHRGGGLVLFPGDNIDVHSWNAELVDRTGLLPARPGDPVGDAKSDVPRWSLQSRNFEHPLVRSWNDSGSGNPATAGFFRIAPLTLRDGSNRVILSFADGLPAVVERSVGRGRVLLFASTADLEWNNLAANPGVYVPLMQRILAAITRGAFESVNATCGKSIRLPVPADWVGREVVITAPVSLRPMTRRAESNLESAAVVFESTSRAGVYSAQVGSETQRFAVQSDAAESDLAVRDAAQSGALARFATLSQIDDSPNSTSFGRRARLAAELGKPLLMVTLLLAAIEFLAAMLFSRSK